MPLSGYGDERGGWDGCPGVTRLTNPVEVVTDGMTYQEIIEILSGSVYDYDDCFDNYLDYFDYDDPGDVDDVYGFVEPVEDGMWDSFHGPSDPGREDDSDWTGSGNPINGVGYTSGTDGTGDYNISLSVGTDSPGDPGEHTDSHQTGFGEPVTDAMSVAGPHVTANGDRQPISTG